MQNEITKKLLEKELSRVDRYRAKLIETIRGNIPEQEPAPSPAPIIQMVAERMTSTKHGKQRFKNVTENIKAVLNDGNLYTAYEMSVKLRKVYYKHAHLKVLSSSVNTLLAKLTKPEDGNLPFAERALIEEVYHYCKKKNK